MLNNISFGKYILGGSIVHKLSPIYKILSLIIMIVSLFFIDSYEDIIMLTMYLFLAISYTDISIKVYIKNILGIRIFILFVLIIDLIFFNSIDRIIFDLFKLLFIVLYSSILTMTTSIMEMTYGIEKILSPFGRVIPVRDVATIITLTLRYIPLIHDEACRVIRAQKFRGVNFDSKNIKEKIEAISTVFIPIFILSLEKSEKFADVMDIRLYNYSKSRTSYLYKKFGLLDLFLLILNILILIIVIIY